MKKYFVILSSGSYSDYSPNYYMGDSEINQGELEEKGVEVGDILFDEFLKLPERKSTSKWDWDKNKMERYDSAGKTVSPPSSFEWMPLMEKWLFEKGYEKMPDNIPEVNIHYQIPTTKSF